MNINAQQVILNARMHVNNSSFEGLFKRGQHHATLLAQQASLKLSQHLPTWCSNEANMLHPTMLGDVGPTCWLRLNRPLNLIC